MNVYRLTAFYFFCIGFSSAIYSLLLRRARKRANESFALGFKIGSERTVEMLKSMGALPPSAELTVTIESTEPKDEHKQDAQFLRSLKIKP